MSSRTPVPENAPGDFYVEDGCCTRCEVPMAEAPEHFGFSEHSCYVCKQPRTPVEVDRMINAMDAQELGCIRYRGQQRDVQIRLVALGAASSCDDLPPGLAPTARGLAFIQKLWGFVVRRRIRRQ